MAIKSEAEIYRILEGYLKSTDTPLSSSTLWEHADVQAHARSAEKVSDYLGLMWRRNLLQRWNTPATATSRARYAYTWKDESSDLPAPIAQKLKDVSTPHKRGNVVITEDNDRVVLDFDKFTIIVQAKG